MRKMANVVVIVLSVTIGLFFILIGTIKLTPAINEEVYKEMVIMNIYLYATINGSAVYTRYECIAAVGMHADPENIRGGGGGREPSFFCIEERSTRQLKVKPHKLRVKLVPTENREET